MFLGHFFEALNDPMLSETFYIEYLALHQYLGEVDLVGMFGAVISLL